MMGKRVTNKQIIDAIPGTGAIQVMIAKKLDVHESTISRRIQSSKKIQEALLLERETTLDIVEGQLVKNAKAGKSWAVRFLLATKGKYRGFTTRTEIEGDLGLNHRGQVHIYLPPNGRDGQPRIESSKPVDGASEPPRIELADGADGVDGGDDDPGQNESRSV